MTEGLLHFSTNSGRYQVGDDEHAPDLTSGASCEMYLGEWIAGHVEHVPYYAVERSVHPSGRTGGYVFFADNGSICGVCAGMKVRL